MSPDRPWNPWAALRARPHVEFGFARLDDCIAYIEDGPLGRVVVLDELLDRRERRVALGHELVHDERDLLYDDFTPTAIVEKEEAIVERILTDRLVPRRLLRHLVDRLDALGEGITARDVADEFDVTDEIGRRALELLAVRA